MPANTCAGSLKIMCFRKVSQWCVFNLYRKYAVPGVHFLRIKLAVMLTFRVQMNSSLLLSSGKSRRCFQEVAVLPPRAVRCLRPNPPCVPGVHSGRSSQTALACDSSTL